MPVHEDTQPVPAAGFGEANGARVETLELQASTGERCELSRGQEIRIGRSRQADLRLTDPTVSRLHAALHVGPTGVRLMDLGSRNGTWFAGRRVVATQLLPDDGFRLGTCRLRLGVSRSVASRCTRLGDLIGASAVMRDLYRRIESLAPTPLDVLVCGETGTGKELVARTLHACSGRPGPFVVLDCAALGTLADATLFGFRKGSFTGADRSQAGVFEAADGGTLFLDEVGELDLELQRKLLGVLERRSVTRLGEPGRARSFDLRVVAATHRELRPAVSEGRFRADLYFRMARAELRVPALRERGQDVVLLARAFAVELAEAGRATIELDDVAVAQLLRYPWPGNVRELRNAVARAVHLDRATSPRFSDLTVLRGSPSRFAPQSFDGGLDALSRRQSYAEFHRAFDRWLLPQLLDQHGDNLTQLAAHLGLSRDTLRKRLREADAYPRSGPLKARGRRSGTRA